MKKLSHELKSALALGTMCIISYLGCYLARNLLSVVTPEMVSETSFTYENIGTLSTVYMVVYALGQLVNGRIGDMLRAKWLVGIGLFFTGVFNFMIPLFDSILVITVVYGASGLFQSMIYAPLMRSIAENTTAHYAHRCALGFSVASFLATPAASVVSMIFNWKYAFWVCGGAMMLLGVACYVCFDIFERRGIVKYKERVKGERQKADYPLLIRRGLIRFTVIAVLTGITRTSVVFWTPTYLNTYLGFSDDISAVIFSVITVIKAVNPYVAILVVYEKIFKRNMNVSLLLMFFTSAVAFFGMFLVSEPFLNVLLLTVALFTSGCAASLLFSVWCPSLADTGMVSTATGFVDAASYLGAGVANLLFANAITTIGWGWLIISWSALMVVGILISLPLKKAKPDA